MGDGNLKLPDKILRIYTNSFIKEDVELLALGITNKLVACLLKTKVVHDRNNQYIITISKSECAVSHATKGKKSYSISYVSFYVI